MIPNRWVSKAQKGNEKALLKLLEEEKVKLYKMAYVYMKNEEDALDVVQETVTKAFIKIHTIKEQQYFSTWLTKILINTALEMLRKKPLVIEFPKELGVHDNRPIEEKMDVLQAIEDLDEKYKSVIILRYYQDLKIEQIAAILNCPEGTVKTNIHRGLQQLKKQLTKGGSEYGEGY